MKGLLFSDKTRRLWETDPLIKMNLCARRLSGMALEPLPVLWERVCAPAHLSSVLNWGSLTV